MDDLQPFLIETPLAIRELRFAVIDLETTGGSPKAFWDKQERFHPPSEITDVGIVKMAGPVIEDSFECLAAVEGPYPANIQRLTGITPDLLVDADSWERVALKSAPHLEGRVWVAHHAPFDGSFLKAWLPQGLWHRHRLICTRLLAKALIPEAQSRALVRLCALLGIPNRRPHRALPDAEATAELMKHLIERAEAQGLDGEGFLKLGEVGWGKL
ncbi:MAG: 3'-5' exonuclease [Holophagaceae bacterium]|nr:3'-5' exonuclease [Holophagaceae bacterium]